MGLSVVEGICGIRFDFQPRKAQYLVSIQEWFGRMKPEIQGWIREMGWTKAKELVGVVTNDNAEEWQNRFEANPTRK